jgi:hypothetical protein
MPDPQAQCWIGLPEHHVHQRPAASLRLHQALGYDREFSAAGMRAFMNAKTVVVDWREQQQGYKSKMATNALRIRGHLPYSLKVRS